MNLRRLQGVCFAVSGLGAVTLWMLGPEMLNDKDIVADLLAVERLSETEIPTDFGGKLHEVPSNKSPAYSSSPDIEVVGGTESSVSIGADHQQFIGQWLDPDSTADDNIQATVQFIGDPEAVDDNFEDSLSPLVMSEEDPDAVLEAPGTPYQFIGQAQAVEQLAFVDSEVTQIIGEPELVPSEPE